MTDREQYTPGPASGAQVIKDGVEKDKDKWTLILVRGALILRNLDTIFL